VASDRPPSRCNEAHGEHHTVAECSGRLRPCSWLRRGDDVVAFVGGCFGIRDVREFGRHHRVDKVVDVVRPVVAARDRRLRRVGHLGCNDRFLLVT